MGGLLFLSTDGTIQYLLPVAIRLSKQHLKITFNIQGQTKSLRGPDLDLGGSSLLTLVELLDNNFW